MENRLTFAELDALAEERAKKKRELTDRLAKCLEVFTFEELRWLFSHELEGARLEAYEIARSRARG